MILFIDKIPFLGHWMTDFPSVKNTYYVSIRTTIPIQQPKQYKNWSSIITHNPYALKNIDRRRITVIFGMLDYVQVQRMILSQRIKVMRIGTGYPTFLWFIYLSTGLTHTHNIHTQHTHNWIFCWCHGLCWFSWFPYTQQIFCWLSTTLPLGTGDSLWS